MPTKILSCCVLLLTARFAVADYQQSAPITLTPVAGSPDRSKTWITPRQTSKANSFAIDVKLNPVTDPDGDPQTVAGLTIGLSDKTSKVLPHEARSAICFELREATLRGSWDVWVNGVNESRRQPNPRPPGWAFDAKNQLPWEFTPHKGIYHIRIIGTPLKKGTNLRFYLDHMDRPVFTHRTKRSITPGHIGFYAVVGGNKKQQRQTMFHSLSVRSIPPNDPMLHPSARDIVLNALDFGRPDLAAVAREWKNGNRQKAGQLFLEHMRTRTVPKPAPLELRVYAGNYKKVAEEVLKNRYGTLGFSAKFSETFVDGAGKTHRFVDENGTIRWDLCNGFLTRHFHWVSMAKLYTETKTPKLAQRFSKEVKEWVAREPFFHPRNPDIGGVNMMDGTTFQSGFMNTSNIGRRCELTWWPAYGVFSKSPHFGDDAHFHMLLGFLRQSRLLMNPSSFAAHDDGGSHGAVALLQNALMLPEFTESNRWKKEALRRMDVVLKVQFLPDGSHTSLSTGYNWASIMSLENLVSLFRRTEQEVPSRFLKALEHSYRHPIGLSRPNQGQIDLNDGGWGMIDDHMQRAYALFPNRKDFLWMATKGKQGTPPKYSSIHFPNAGHFVLRTGWGPKERYLFMDAGPVGASHGKEDKLSIYLDYGGHQLLASGGRGAYSGGPFAAYAGSTRGYNTLLVDGGVQARIPFRFEITGPLPVNPRFESNKSFDYAEGFHTHGWFTPKKHTKGKHTRQILFIKGSRPPESSYWVVFDTVDPEDDQSHLYEALFHIRRNHAGLVDKNKKIVHGWDAAASLRIMPAIIENLEVELVRGQMKPHIQGWHVVGKAHAPMWTPVYRWNAKGTTTRAWVLVPAGPKQNWCVDRVQVIQNKDGLVIIECRRKDGGRDIIYRRDPNRPEDTIVGVRLTGDVGVVTQDSQRKMLDNFSISPR